MSSASAAIVVTGLRRTFGKNVALDGVNFEALPGQVVGLLGPNGAGKTTLLECILGLQRPDAGDVKVLGRKPATVRDQTGAQPQTGALPGKIRPREALRLHRRFHRSPRAEKDIVESFGLAAFLERPVETLSVGQRQRLGLALAFLSNPRVVVLDEPTAGLDPQGKRELQALIRRERDAGTCILMATHDLTEAAELCDRVVVIRKGKVLRVMDPRELGTHGGGQRVRFQVMPDVSHEIIATWAGCAGAAREGEGWLVQVRPAEPFLAAFTQWARDSGAQVRSLTLVEPGLEEIFFELTGEAEERA